MNTKPTRKKWTRTEWLLLLAPLMIVIGLGAMNFAPQLQRAWREWREYGNNRPYAILRLQPYMNNQKVARFFDSFAFSPDGKSIVIAETTLESWLGTFAPSPTHVHLWRIGTDLPVFSWESPLHPNSFVSQIRYSDEKTVSIAGTLFKAPPTKVFYEEKRDTRNGRLISRQSLKLSPKRDNPAGVESITPSNSSSPKFLERKKDGVSVKVSFSETAIQRPKNVKPYLVGKYVKVQFFAEVVDAKQRSKHRFALTAFNDINIKNRSSFKSIGVAFSPDLRFLFVFMQDRDSRYGAAPPKVTVEVFDTRSRKSLWRQSYNENFVQAVAFSSRGLLAMSETRGGITVGSNPTTWSTRTELRSIQTGQLLRVLQKEGINGLAALNNMQFSPDGKLLAVPQDDRLELWDVSDLN